MVRSWWGSGMPGSTLSPRGTHRTCGLQGLMGAQKPEELGLIFQVMMAAQNAAQSRAGRQATVTVTSGTGWRESIDNAASHQQPLERARKLTSSVAPAI